jgi:hypothetical protein
MSLAIEALEKTKQEVTERYQQDIAELDRVIANIKQLPLSKRTTNSAKPRNGHAVPVLQMHGSWEGMGITDAVHAFLSNYEGPVRFRDLMSGLQARGVKLGDATKPQRYQANLKTTVINNRRRFSYNKSKDTVRLLQRTTAV